MLLYHKSIGATWVLFAPEELGRIRRDCGCPSGEFDDAGQNGRSDFEIGDGRVHVSDGLWVRAVPRGVFEGDGVLAAHEAYVAVVWACFVKVGDGPEFSG